MDLLKRIPMRRHVFSLLTLTVVLNLCSPAHSVAVMSVDFGSEWMKVAIVSPGVPMEIALNKESKRKTPIAIAFRDGERTFGEDAMTVCVRFPKNCYMYLLDLLGKQVDNPVVQAYMKRFPHYNIVPDPERGTVVFQHDEETQFSVEELVAMMITKAREMAVLSANQPINEVVITTPGFFNQAERKALVQAAELAGLKVLQLMNDYTAVALNYGIFRRKDFNETAQYIMLYDMGASSTSASIVSYQVVKTKEKGFLETNPQLSILGVGYDRTLGGLEMQLRLRDYLAAKFNEMKKTKNDVTQNPRSMAKLFKEAGRLKNVLSANADHYAQVEGLIDEVDFKLQVTREDFEKLCTDLFDRVGAPVQQALKTAGLSMDIMSQVILVGAGTRVPAVQEKLSSIVGIDLSKNLNTDEAAVFGAVYKAADLSAGFKVKKFITKDTVLFPIQVTFEREVEGGGTRQTKRTLFGLMNSYPQKKILTFNKNLTDFDFNVGYGELEYLPPQEIGALGSLNITKVSLSGVAEAIGKHQGPGVESKGIKAHFQMDDSGILNLVNVEHVVEKTIASEEEPEESPLSKLGSTISKLFTGPEESLKETLEKPDEKDEGKEGEKKDDKGAEGNKTRDGADKDENKPKDNKPKIITLKEPIQSQEEPLAVQSMNEKLLQEAQAKIDRYNLNDEQKRRHEGALNALESFVFEARAKLDLKEYQSAATQEEADAITKSCSEMSEWLEENGFEADADTLENKLKELKKLTNKVWDRVKEHQERPDALAALNSVINGSMTFFNTIKNMTEHATPENAIFTEVEITSLEKVIKETEDWRVKAVAEQNDLPLNQSPKLTIKLIMEKMAILDREVKYLVNKAKIWKPKVPPPMPEDETKEKTVNATQSNKTDIPAESDHPEDQGDIESSDAPIDASPAPPSEEPKDSTEGADEDSLKHTEL
ncbi:hypothetical protein GE061_012797 [Apolygus lucorum]|uniref:Hypoxia up-regulated protein 1 n=1 Tax=Apolygus lucorum TaxID=248454 RepID=A0A8S9XXD9_APOLU|nr:hypothetical protein GE061_012797 [Apolygus lucorum]